jgi:hypothetical protein
MRRSVRLQTPYKEKKMRKTLCTSVLVLALCGTTLAGDMSCPPIAPGEIPTPPSASQPSGEETSDNLIETGATAETTSGDNADGLAATALTVLNSVLALL